jgi:hypothetical protein
LSTFTKLKRLSSEGSLVDLAFFGTGKGDTVVFELVVSVAYERSRNTAHLNDGVGCLTTHVVDSILVSKPIGPLDSVVPDE